MNQVTDLTVICSMAADEKLKKDNITWDGQNTVNILILEVYLF